MANIKRIEAFITNRMEAQLNQDEQNFLLTTTNGNYGAGNGRCHNAVTGACSGTNSVECVNEYGSCNYTDNTGTCANLPNPKPENVIIDKCGGITNTKCGF